MEEKVMRTCNRCGNIVDDKEPFCSRCGGANFTDVQPMGAQEAQGGNTGNGGQLHNSVMQQVPQQYQNQQAPQQRGGNQQQRMMNQQQRVGNPQQQQQQQRQQQQFNNQMQNNQNQNMQRQQIGNRMPQNSQMGMQGNMQLNTGFDQQSGFESQGTYDYNDDITNEKKSFIQKFFLQEYKDGSSVKDWLLLQIFMMIPILNIITIFKALTSDDTPAYKKTYFKAFIVYFIIAAILSIMVTSMVACVGGGIASQLG